MPTLNWIGKEAVVKHHKEVPFRLLEPVPELGCGPAQGTDSGNLIVQGDNLHALKALLPRYAGRVKCIYIDPPYNTGNEGWAYNDNVNSPEIRRWLGEVVGKEGETLDRHDRWLCMMYPRLVLLKQFLREDGAIFVSIDDNEVATLRLLMDEIFGAGNLLAHFVQQAKDTPGNNSRGVAATHDHLLAFVKTHCFAPNLLVRDEKQLATYKNPDKDVRGPWLGAPLTRGEFRERDYYPLVNPAGVEVWPPRGTCWRRPKGVLQRLIDEKRLWWGKDGNSSFPMEKKFLSEVKDGVVNQTWWPYEFSGSTRNANAELKELFGGERLFDTPKPTRLIQRILQIATDKDALILDSFAGSGTTGHAVLKQNADDGGSRRFILVEMDANIALNVTRERVQRVARGYTHAKGQAVEGLGGGFQFCRLSAEPLFDAGGQIRHDVGFAQLAEFVWFAETGAGWNGHADSPLLGIFEGRAIYLLYNGILKDKSAAGGNVLTGPVFDRLPQFAGPKVIYAAANRMGPRAARESVCFKQTPYALEV